MLGGRVAKIALAIAALVLAGYLLRLLTWDAEDEYGIALADTAVADAAERACARSGGTFAVSRPGDDYLAVLARAHGEDFATALKRGDAEITTFSCGPAGHTTRHYSFQSASDLGRALQAHDGRPCVLERELVDSLPRGAPELCAELGGTTSVDVAAQRSQAPGR